MTHAMMAIGWLDVGDVPKARTAFLKNYDNIIGPFKVPCSGVCLLIVLLSASFT